MQHFFQPHEWTLMEKLTELLGLFHSITNHMSHRYANSGDIIPHVKIFKAYVNDEVTRSRFTGLHTTITYKKHKNYLHGKGSNSFSSQMFFAKTNNMVLLLLIYL